MSANGSSGHPPQPTQKSIRRLAMTARPRTATGRPNNNQEYVSRIVGGEHRPRIFDFEPDSDLILVPVHHSKASLCLILSSFSLVVEQRDAKTGS
jgi:hypothetical protein